MKKYILDLVVRSATQPRPGYVLLQLTNPSEPLPEMQPGQFVEVRIDDAPGVFLRRPISINLVDREANELWLLVHVVGAGTRALAQIREGAVVNVVLPLGNGFSLPESPKAGSGDGIAGRQPRPLLIGGGIGTAPLLYLGQRMVECGIQPVFLLGARTVDDLMQLEDFRRLGTVYITTEDGGAGERGFVTQHSVWQQATFTSIHTCGPKPMMMAIARLAREKGIPCEVSLENMMACGLGACLCCVEDTKDGNVCVCTEGPVFDIEKLKW